MSSAPPIRQGCHQTTIHTTAPHFAVLSLESASVKGATSDRVIEYWEKSRLKRDKFRCSLTSTPREGGGSLIDESCKRYFQPVAFVNRYWLKADDTIECSRQWIHPKLSPLQFFSTEQQALTLNLTKNGC